MPRAAVSKARINLPNVPFQIIQGRLSGCHTFRVLDNTNALQNFRSAIKVFPWTATSGTSRTTSNQVPDGQQRQVQVGPEGVQWAVILLCFQGAF